MTLTHEEHKRHSFDSYCKKVLKYTARTYYSKLRRQSGHETPFSNLPDRELAKLDASDTYFTDEYVFEVLGESVGVSDYDLAAALNELPADRRGIVLMSYFLDMTDKEIAGLLNMTRRTVAYRRINSLRELKKQMESED